MHTLYEHILRQSQSHKKALAVLIDPDDSSIEDCLHLIELTRHYKPDFFFVGGSLITAGKIDEIVTTLKTHTSIPVVLFPGSNLHLSPKADALLFLSLISGRNAEFLIGQQVVAAPLVRKMGLEAISTGYLLINCGKMTTAIYMSNTIPIPYNKKEIAVATAIAGEMLGMKLIYMDGGSGADCYINPDMIQAVKKNIQTPLIVGGGIRQAEDAQKVWTAGADLIVIGNSIEENPTLLQTYVEVRNHINNTN